MPHILLLEDDDNIAFGIRTSLQKKQIDVSCYSSLHAAKEHFSHEIDLVLLDLNLPDGSGYEFCRYVKELRDVPVIFLTVRDEEHDIVKGLDMGADDYITKPFLLSVLYSRINAVLRRTATGTETIPALFTCGSLSLNTDQTKVFLNHEEIELTAGEYRLLSVFMQNKNQTLTRTRLLELLWDANGSFVNDNTLTVTMKRLREKLKNTSYIKTLRGIGYRLEDSE